MKYAIRALLIGTLLFLLHSGVVYAAENDPVPGEELKEVWVTCYTATSNPCANGKYPEEGIVAYCPEYIDEYIVLMWASEYGAPGTFIGAYEVWDTGNPNIQQGKVIDVYQDTLEDCTAFMQQFEPKVFIELITKEEYDVRQRLRENGNTEDNSGGCIRDGEVPQRGFCPNTSEWLWCIR